MLQQMKSNELAIAIPTYNRSNILKENILKMLDEIQRYSIPIYISDDSPDKTTEEIIFDIKREYPYIFYKKNKPSLGHDKNCLSTLNYPSENYIWYLGDSRIIQKGGIERILQIIDKNAPDFIAVNSENRNVNITSKLYNDGNLLLKELGWHLTLTGATIYSRKMINSANQLDISKYTNFPQTAIIFECFSKQECKLIWLNENFVFNNAQNISYWKKDVFKVFITDWTNCINNLGTYYYSEIKSLAIISHSRNTKLFNLKSILSYRFNGYYGLKEYKGYNKELKKHSNLNTILLYVFAIIPKSTFLLPIHIINKIRTNL